MSHYTIRKILVPIDFSECSLNALEYALALAERKDAALHLLHVSDDTLDFMFLEDTSVMQSVSDNSGDILLALAASIGRRHGTPPEVTIVPGAVHTSILRLALQQGVDLIVMGTHGASGYRDSFTGTNTYNVIKHASCPVLTVPPRYKRQSMGRVLFPIRAITGALHRYDVLRTLISPSQTSLQILGVSNRGLGNELKVLEEVASDIRDRLVEDRVHAEVKTGAGGNVAEDVLQACSQDNADLIVLTSSIDVTTKQSFIGPNTQKILAYARVPVLTIRRVHIPVTAGQE